MSERWVEYDGKFFNMAHVAYFGTFKGEMYAYFAFGLSYEAPSKQNEGGDAHPNCFFIGRYDDGNTDPNEIIRAIIRGDYDVSMDAKPTDAQASDDVRDDNKFNTDDEVYVDNDTIGRVVRGIYDNLTKSWTYYIAYNGGDSEWIEESRLTTAIPF